MHLRVIAINILLIIVCLSPQGNRTGSLMRFQTLLLHEAPFTPLAAEGPSLMTWALAIPLMLLKQIISLSLIHTSVGVADTVVTRC